jgi:hypothetical protein
MGESGGDNLKKKRSVFGASILIVILFLMQTSVAFAALTLQGAQTWYWTDNTHIRSVAKGDVDGDGQVEIVTGGWYNDGTRTHAQLCVWNGATLALENIQTWYWTGDTYIRSVAVGDVDGDGQVEIVTGGYHYDGTRDRAQLCVWSGSSLALEDVKTWYWTSYTRIASVAVGDVDGDGKTEIVTGGYYLSSYYRAQLCVWDGSSLALEDIKTWYWTSHTYILSVALGDVDGDGNMEIVTGGYHYDGARSRAQLCVWDGSSLALEDIKTWYWTSDTYIFSVAVGDVDSDGNMEIVTGGYYWDGTRQRAQLCVFSGATLSLENVKSWYWTGSTYINSVALGDVDGDGNMEIVTGGYHYDGARNRAQLCVWSGATLASEDVKTWHWFGRTYIYSVAVGNVDGDGQVEIVTGGTYHDGSRDVAQLCVWA